MLKPGFHHVPFHSDKALVSLAVSRRAKMAAEWSDWPKSTWAAHDSSLLVAKYGQRRQQEVTELKNVWKWIVEIF